MHTPGPWRIGGPRYEGIAIYSEPAAITVAETQDYSTAEENEANARLIAAAPETAAERDRLREINADLLAALQLAFDVLDEGGLLNADDEAYIRATIDKARGS